MGIYNQTIDQIEASKSVTLLAKLKELQKIDPTILNLTGGEPDFNTPAPITEEAYRRMLDGYTHYCDSRGDLELRQAVAKKLNDENQAPYNENQILITPGAKYAIYVAMKAMLNAGDEVLWLTPGWVSYPAIIKLCGGTPVAVHLDYDQNYAITAEKLEEMTTDHTKMLCLNYPNNPTGKILTDNDWVELKKYLNQHPDVYVMSDEIYEKIIFDGKKVKSLASDPELFDRVIIINGFSKCSAMTGWRVGYLACNDDVYERALKVFQHTMSCTNSFAQKSAVVALTLDKETEDMRACYEYRRNMVYEGLSQIPQISFQCPDGAFYAWVKFDTEMDPEELCNKLLDKAGIGGIPGNAYGEEGGCMARFSFATDEATLIGFVKRLAEFCEKEL